MNERAPTSLEYLNALAKLDHKDDKLLAALCRAAVPKMNEFYRPSYLEHLQRGLTAPPDVTVCANAG